MMKFNCRNILLRIFILDSILSIGYVIWNFVGSHGNFKKSEEHFVTDTSPVAGDLPNSIKGTYENQDSSMKDNQNQEESGKRTQRFLHIATTADDVFLPGVIGLIETTYRNSNTKQFSNSIIIQFEIFLTPYQNSSTIEELFNTQEAKENNWAFRIHLIEKKDVDVYRNIRFSWKSGEEKRAVGDSDTPHIYAIHLLVGRLKDVKYVFWIEADTAVRKNIVDFIMKETRTAEERHELSNSQQTKNIEFGLPGKTFRERYGLAAFPRNVQTLKPTVYVKLKELGFKIYGMPHFNSGILLLNLDLWRKEDFDSKLKKLIKINNDLDLWRKFGIQPALNLFFGGTNFFHLPPNTVQMKFGYQKIDKPITTAYFLHWNGEHKPWLKSGMNKHLWAID